MTDRETLKVIKKALIPNTWAIAAVYGSVRTIEKLVDEALSQEPSCCHTEGEHVH